jgi:hypothetical protein
LDFERNRRDLGRHALLKLKMPRLAPVATVRAWLLTLIVLAAVACAYRQSSPEVQAPPPRYTAAEIGGMFERPGTVTELLENLKIATDRDLVAEPGFATKTNLLKFFDGRRITRQAVGPAGVHVNQMDALLTADKEHFPGMSAQIRQGLNRSPPHDSETPGAIKRFGSIRMDVSGIPAFTVGVVRQVFGKETLTLRDTNWATEGHDVPETKRGSLFYGDPADADFLVASYKRKTVTFFVKLSQQDRVTPPYKRDSTISDSHEIARIFIYDPAP